MKKIFILFLLAMSIISCQKDPMSELNDGSWNKEKQLLSIRFTDQVGDASISISAEDSSQGFAEVTILSAQYDTPVEIVAMEVSYNATASVNLGETLIFDSTTKSAEITVTAETGDTRTYTITASELVEELLGTWYINGMNVLGGAATQWGCGAMIDIVGDNDRSMWDATTGTVAELDNTLTFTLEGLTDEGYTYGTCVHDAGADGLYADFTWLEPAGGLEYTDCNDNFRKIPTGTSTWTHNTTAGTVSFTQDGVTVTASMLGSGTHTIYGTEDSYELTVASNALDFTDLTWKTGWDDNVLWTTYGRVVCWPINFYVQYSREIGYIPEAEPYIESSDAELVSISFSSQIGSVAIDQDTKTAEFDVYKYDYSEGLTVTDISISSKATASVEVGDVVTFDATAHTAVITITAENGTTCDYTITANSTDTVDELVGTWKVTAMHVWGGAATQWGCSALVDIIGSNDGSEWDATTGPAAELDNTITFTYVGTNSEGYNYGLCENNAGDDNLYADFTWVGYTYGYDFTDCNSEFRRIPAGTSLWTRTETGVKFEKSGESYECIVHGSGSVAVTGVEDSYSLTVANNALEFSAYNYKAGWDDNILWSNYGRVVCWPINIYIQIAKQ